MHCVGGAGGEDHALAVYMAAALEGPWAPHGPGMFEAEAATGGPASALVWQGVLHRLGRSCRRGDCDDAQLVQVSTAPEAGGRVRVLGTKAGRWPRCRAWHAGCA